jgi:hypothetical protein
MMATGLGVEPIIRYGTAEKSGSPATLYRDERSRAALAFTEVTGGANFDPPDPRVASGR